MITFIKKWWTAWFGFEHEPTIHDVLFDLEADVSAFDKMHLPEITHLKLCLGYSTMNMAIAYLRSIVDSIESGRSVPNVLLPRVEKSEYLTDLYPVGGSSPSELTKEYIHVVNHILHLQATLSSTEMYDFNQHRHTLEHLRSYLTATIMELTSICTKLKNIRND